MEGCVAPGVGKAFRGACILSQPTLFTEKIFLFRRTDKLRDTTIGSVNRTEWKEREASNSSFGDFLFNNLLHHPLFLKTRFGTITVKQAKTKRSSNGCTEQNHNILRHEKAPQNSKKKNKNQKRNREWTQRIGLLHATVGAYVSQSGIEEWLLPSVFFLTFINFS